MIEPGFTYRFVCDRLDEQKKKACKEPPLIVIMKNHSSKTRQEAINLARERGWFPGGKKKTWLCPKCAEQEESNITPVEKGAIITDPASVSREYKKLTGRM